VTRVLVEATEHEPWAALEHVAGIVEMLADTVRGALPQLLVHGEEDAAWPVLRWAAMHGYAVRIGLEDCATRADGTRAWSSADQVADAARLLTAGPHH
jgi:uncharacterized protein (DUF849 family)